MTETLVNQITEQWRGRIEQALDAAFPAEAQPHLNHAIRYHLAAGGKRIRPVLALLTCGQLGGEPEAAFPFAVSAEILHNMFLLHDDVADGDRVRRDKPAVWVKYGMGNAVNCGDYMLARAYRILLDAYLNTPFAAPILDLFTFVLERTIEGQALDINLRGADNLTVENYVRMVELKTGHYLGFTMTGGAIIARAPKDVQDKLAQLGRLLGPAFQIRDDLIDLTEGKGRGGEIGCDIREGKPSMLLAAALERCEAGEKAEVLRVLRKPREETTTRDVRRVIGIFKKCGALDFAQEFADGLVDKALRMIDDIKFKEPETFRAFARFISARKR